MKSEVDDLTSEHGGESARSDVDHSRRRTAPPPALRGLVHSSAAAFLILALLSGSAICSPSLFRALTPVFDSRPLARALHPWFSLGFVIAFLFQVLNWIAPMSMDRRRHSMAPAFPRVCGQRDQS